MDMKSFYLTTEQLQKASETFRTCFPDRMKRSIEYAEKACKGEFKVQNTMVSDQWVFAGNPVNWFYNPTNDLEFTWCFNRHNHMIELGEAYLITGIEKYVETFKEHVLSWIEQNPRPTNLSYSEGAYFQFKGSWRILEVSLRAQSWIWAYNMMKNSDVLDSRFKEILFESLSQHAAHLSVYIGDPDINHAIMEMHGLLMIGALLAEHPMSEYWMKLARERLELSIYRQIGEDGVQIERSVMYHNYCINSFCEPYILAEAIGKPLPKVFEKKLLSMEGFSDATIRPDGQNTPNADSDISDGARALGLLGALFGNENLMKRGKATEYVLWLLGHDRFKQLQELSGGGNGVVKSCSYPTAGFYILRDEKQYLFFSAAAINAPHGHADIGHFEWFWNKQLMFVDPGRYTYEEGEMRRYFKGTGGHNTIVIDGEDQTPYVSTQAWGSPVAIPTVHRWITKDDYDFIDVSHDGYMRCVHPVLHRRWLFMSKASDLLVVVDWLTGEGKHTLNQRFNLDSSAQVKIQKNHNSKIENTENYIYDSARIFFSETSYYMDANWWMKGKNVCDVNYDEAIGWMSQKYGEKKAIPVLSLECSFSSPLAIVSVFTPIAQPGLDAGFHIGNVNIDIEHTAVNITMVDRFGTRQLEITENNLVL